MPDNEESILENPVFDPGKSIFLPMEEYSQHRILRYPDLEKNLHDVLTSVHFMTKLFRPDLAYIKCMQAREVFGESEELKQKMECIQSEYPFIMDHIRIDCYPSFDDRYEMLLKAYEKFLENQKQLQEYISINAIRLLKEIQITFMHLDKYDKIFDMFKETSTPSRFYSVLSELQNI